MLLAVVQNSYGAVIYLIAAVAAGGLAQVVYQIVRNWRRKPIDDQQIIGKQIKDDLGNLKDLLAEYRLEVEVNKRQLEDYRRQLTEITLELAKAQARIGLLEDQLRTARSEHESVQHELEAMQRRRDELQGERDRLKQEAANLGQRIKALEDATGVTERIAVAGRSLDPPPQE